MASDTQHPPREAPSGGVQEAVHIVRLWASGGSTRVSDYLMSDGSIKTLTIAEAEALTKKHEPATQEAELEAMRAELLMADENARRWQGLAVISTELAQLSAAPSAQEAGPVAWSPAYTTSLRTWTNGTPDQQTVDYWLQQGVAIAYAYEGAAPQAPAAPTDLNLSDKSTQKRLAAQWGLDPEAEFERGRQQGMLQERALWQLEKTSEEPAVLRRLTPEQRSRVIELHFSGTEMEDDEFDSAMSLCEAAESALAAKNGATLTDEA